MKQFLLLTFALFLMTACCHHNENKPLASSSVITAVPDSTKQAIIASMTASKEAWNSGSMEDYMQVYWKSDSLQFMGIKSITKGYHQTLANYKRGYPDAATRGTLSYTFHHFNQLSLDCVLVIGKFHLAREIGDAEGYFSLIWKQIDGEWKIILDHT
ncbi:MAG: nuclear transport factor 2 family protein [Marinilabiliaceae bacterium]|nr:nuclear transport factor 2 family protein [Marinilabiliaceae bacterium]